MERVHIHSNSIFVLSFCLLSVVKNEPSGTHTAKHSRDARPRLATRLVSQCAFFSFYFFSVSAHWRLRIHCFTPAGISCVRNTIKRKRRTNAAEATPSPPPSAESTGCGPAGLIIRTDTNIHLLSSERHPSSRLVFFNASDRKAGRRSDLCDGPCSRVLSHLFGTS